MVRSQVFRGYRAQTTAFTGILAFVAAALQPRLVPHPWLDLPGYLLLWGGVAILCVGIFGTEQVIRCRRLQSPLQNERTFEALERFIPSLAAGAILTVVFEQFVTEQCWMLPAMWALCFSLGVFASRTLMPRGMSVVGGYYLMGAMFNLVFARGPHAFSPWAMALTFGVGQFLSAAVLYWNLERRHARI